ncbi:hypothetical protein GpartN1_g4068.t1 [Galdieria partita]|uniref:Uncharacterized protein n=1 Tax=Galdieria partita TaxID=83374 RepID=A0A9C7PVT4_9RHOD|nr:hypothetical protein GpartN1_g3316.t1 [Galdieria partita]GJQ12277.1 hypothetical protein GpartN1_g4068.t1 [Galdieria partita]
MTTLEEQENLIKSSPEKEERPAYQSTKAWNESSPPRQQHSLGGKRRVYSKTLTPNRQEFTSAAVKDETSVTNITEDVDRQGSVSSFSLWRLVHSLLGNVLFSVFFYVFLFPLLFVFVFGVLLAAIVSGVYCIYLACMSRQPPSPLPLLVFLPFVLVLYGILLVFGAQRSSHSTLAVFWGRLCFSMGVIAGFSTPFYLWWKQVLDTMELLYAGLGTLLLTISFAMTILLLESDMLSPRQLITTQNSTIQPA